MSSSCGLSPCGDGCRGLGPGSSFLRLPPLRTISAPLTMIPFSTSSPPHAAAALEKPTLSVHPPWTTIFKGERVTLRCDGYHPLVVALRPISTLWYLGHLLLPSHRRSIEVQTPGVYRCQTRGALVSDPVHLSVSNGEWLRGRGSVPLLTWRWLLCEGPLGHCHSGRRRGLSCISGAGGGCVALRERCSQVCLSPRLPPLLPQQVHMSVSL